MIKRETRIRIKVCTSECLQQWQPDGQLCQIKAATGINIIDGGSVSRGWEDHTAKQLGRIDDVHVQSKQNAYPVQKAES